MKDAARFYGCQEIAHWIIPIPTAIYDRAVDLTASSRDTKEISQIVLKLGTLTFDIKRSSLTLTVPYFSNEAFCCKVALFWGTKYNYM